MTAYDPKNKTLKDIVSDIFRNAACRHDKVEPNKKELDTLSNEIVTSMAEMRLTIVPTSLTDDKSEQA